MGNINIKGIIEAVLFASGNAVTLKSIAFATGCGEDEAQKAVEEMKKECESDGRGVRIVELDGSYTMCTKKEAYDYLIKIAARPTKYVLTDVLLETLSIVAHMQPVTRQEVGKIRGVNSDHALNKLVEYGLVEEAGRMDAPGKPVLFETTEEFYRRFGIHSQNEIPDHDFDGEENEKNKDLGIYE